MTGAISASAVINRVVLNTCDETQKGLTLRKGQPS